jgi:hypothetical protein
VRGRILENKHARLIKIKHATEDDIAFHNDHFSHLQPLPFGERRLGTPIHTYMQDV